MHETRVPAAGDRNRRALEHPRLDVALHAASLGVDRALHRAVDPRQDRRPGRARQRRAPRPVRRAVAADVLAHRRDRRDMEPSAAAAVNPATPTRGVGRRPRAPVGQLRRGEAPPHVVTGWHRDGLRVVLGREEPGEIEPGGLAEKAGALVASYEFADPAILRAAYRTPATSWAATCCSWAASCSCGSSSACGSSTSHDERARRRRARAADRLVLPDPRRAPGAGPADLGGRQGPGDRLASSSASSRSPAGRRCPTRWSGSVSTCSAGGPSCGGTTTR